MAAVRLGLGTPRQFLPGELRLRQPQMMNSEHSCAASPAGLPNQKVSSTSNSLSRRRCPLPASALVLFRMFGIRRTLSGHLLLAHEIGRGIEPGYAGGQRAGMVVRALGVGRAAAGWGGRRAASELGAGVSEIALAQVVFDVLTGWAVARRVGRRDGAADRAIGNAGLIGRASHADAVRASSAAAALPAAVDAAQFFDR